MWKKKFSPPDGDGPTVFSIGGTLRAFIAAAGALCVVFGFAGALNASATPGSPHKVTICHRTASTTNPYVQITVDAASVDGNAGNNKGQGDHLLEHTGPVFSKDLPKHTEWGDIIPPFYADGSPTGYPALNWNAEGKAIFENGCKPVTNTPTPPPTTTQPTTPAPTTTTATQPPTTEPTTTQPSTEPAAPVFACSGDKEGVVTIPVSPGWYYIKMVNGSWDNAVVVTGSFTVTSADLPLAIGVSRTQSAKDQEKFWNFSSALDECKATPTPTTTATQPPTTQPTTPAPTESTSTPTPTTPATQPAGQVKATVTPNKLSCTVTQATANVTVGQQSSIGYAKSKSAQPTWVQREAKAAEYTVKLPEISKGASASWYIVVSSMDDSVKPAWLGPFTFHRPSVKDCQPAVVTPPSSTPTPDRGAGVGTGALPEEGGTPWVPMGLVGAGLGLMALGFRRVGTTR